MENTCYQCRYLIQGGDGSNGCLKFPDPEHPQYPRMLDDDPTPLYDDCYEVIAEVIEFRREA